MFWWGRGGGGVGFVEEGVHHEVGVIGFYDGGGAGFADDVGEVGAEECGGGGGEVGGAGVGGGTADDGDAAELAWEVLMVGYGDWVGWGTFMEVGEERGDEPARFNEGFEGGGHDGGLVGRHCGDYGRGREYMYICSGVEVHVVGCTRAWFGVVRRGDVYVEYRE